MNITSYFHTSKTFILKQEPSGMANSIKPQSAILYQNSERTITLLDIPKSISLAQGTSASHCTQTIYSSPPVKTPYPSTEPKSEAAKANVMRRMKTNLTECPEAFLLQALDEIKKNYDGEWCLPRQVSSLVYSGQKRKRKLSHDQMAHDVVAAVEPVIEMLLYENIWNRKASKISIVLNEHVVNEFPNAQRIAHQFVHNPHSTPISLRVKSTAQAYRIPPESAFYLANINERNVTEFSTAARSFYPTPTASAGPGQFNLILLDPPWDNRSVRRSREYGTKCQSSDPLVGLRNMLGTHIAPEALIACWITNKASSREHAIKAFSTWGVELIEEWIWLKTTISGQPVTDIKGLWRRPYEILLLGKKSDPMTQALDGSCAAQCEVYQRLIVAMPDFHSRKPCLKELLEQNIAEPMNYRALEIFPRILTSGWCSWGNEPIKYNWQGYWPAVYT